MTVDPAQLILLLLYVAAPVGVLLYMLRLTFTRGSEPKRDSITIQYEPPDQLSPAECGALMENTIDVRDITATITDLSVRGYLSIEPTDAALPAGQGATQKDYVFHLRKAPQEWDGLRPHERIVMQSIFMPESLLQIFQDALLKLREAQRPRDNQEFENAMGRVLSKTEQASDEHRATFGGSDGPCDSVALSQARNQFALHLRTIRDAVYAKLVSDGYYAGRPDQIRTVYAASGIFIGVILAGGGAVLAVLTKSDPVALAAAGLLTGVFIVAFGWFMPARTVKGASTLGKILGFREFLSRVEKDRIKRLEKTPALFEKFLPHAMALGVEDKWTETFAEVAVLPPRWYEQPGGGFLPIKMVADLNQMQASARLTTTGTAAAKKDAADSIAVN